MTLAPEPTMPEQKMPDPTTPELTTPEHRSAAVAPLAVESANAPRRLSWTSTTWEEKGILLLFAALAAVLAFPLLSLYYSLLGVSHFQHFPLLLIAGVVFAYRNIKQDGFEYIGELSTRTMLWLSSAILLTAVVFVLPSRWMAAPAAFCWLIAVITYLGGPELRATLSAPMWFALALVPPPFVMATWFIQKLQSVATSIASYWLDYFDIYHYTTGVSILTPNSSYLVKDACSGIQSVFAAIALGVFYGAMRRYRVARFLLLLTQLVFWVLVANALRVFLIMYMKERYQIDLVDGWAHEMVGAVTFMLGLALAMSFDHLSRFLVPLYEPEELIVEENAVAPANAPVAAASEEVAAEAPAFALLEYVPARIVSYSVLGLILVASSACVAALYKFEVPQLKIVTIKDLVDQCVLDFSQIDEEMMPQQLNGWSQVGYEKEEREEDSTFGGMVSYRWQYMHPDGRRVVLSIDGPYDNWHDLSVCYRQVGWEMVSTDRASFARLSRPAVAYDLHMRRGGVDQGQSIFLCWDQTGRNIEAPENYGAVLTTFVSRLRNLFNEPKPIVGGAIQLQLYSQKAMSFSPAEYEENRQLFWAATEWLTQKFPAPSDSEGGK
jgi:exosortase